MESQQRPEEAGVGAVLGWGYDEITWFARQSRAYRASWLRYATDWVRAPTRTASWKCREAEL